MAWALAEKHTMNPPVSACNRSHCLHPSWSQLLASCSSLIAFVHGCQPTVFSRCGYGCQVKAIVRPKRSLYPVHANNNEDTALNTQLQPDPYSYSHKLIDHSLLTGLGGWEHAPNQQEPHHKFTLARGAATAATVTATSHAIHYGVVNSLHNEKHSSRV